MRLDGCGISLVIVSSILVLLICSILIGIFMYMYKRRKSSSKGNKGQKAKDGAKQSKTSVTAVVVEKKVDPPAPPAPPPSQPPAQEPVKAKEKSDERRAEEGAAGFAPVEVPKPKPKSMIATQPTQLDTFKKPENETMADAKDPNYRSMKGIGNDVFNVPPKPVTNADDQYEVLSNLQNIVPVAEVKTPAAGDQYESLVDLNNQEIINKKAAEDKEKPEEDDAESTKGKDKISNKGVGNKSAEKALDQKKGASPAALPPPPPPPPPPAPNKKKGPAFKRPEMGKVSSKNPQYETFAGVSDAIFQDEKKPE
uniref:Uncharacterized protein n=1 Tax=Ditylenchus dipsaci TaxID=166011 RepID=A0A915CN12_9BILA